MKECRLTKSSSPYRVTQAASTDARYTPSCFSVSLSRERVRILRKVIPQMSNLLCEFEDGSINFAFFIPDDHDAEI
jgi:hypothetical protein